MVHELHDQEKHMRFKPVAIALTLVCLGSIAACTRKSSAGAGNAATPEQITTVKVVNEGFLDMAIYVSGAPVGARMRLGTAIGSSTTKMTIPKQIMLYDSTPLKFFADPVGGSRTSVSSSIVVTRGDEVTLRIPPS
jgi:hypothetical protein